MSWNIIPAYRPYMGYGSGELGLTIQAMPARLCQK